MATILRGKRKGEVVEISQFANDWVMLRDNAILSPTSLEYTDDEKRRIDQDTGKGVWYYRWKGNRLSAVRSLPIRDGYGQETGERA